MADSVSGQTAAMYDADLQALPQFRFVLFTQLLWFRVRLKGLCTAQVISAAPISTVRWSMSTVRQRDTTSSKQTES